MHAYAKLAMQLKHQLEDNAKLTTFNGEPNQGIVLSLESINHLCDTLRLLDIEVIRWWEVPYQSLRVEKLND